MDYIFLMDTKFVPDICYYVERNYAKDGHYFILLFSILHTSLYRFKSSGRGRQAMAFKFRFSNNCYFDFVVKCIGELTCCNTVLLPNHTNSAISFISVIP